MSTTAPFWPFVAVILAIAFVLGGSRKRNKVLYPPGPKPRLFVGNLFDIPMIKPWKVYRDWGKSYGELIHVEAVGQHIVVVNSRKLADRMLEKRSRIYSDRPGVPILDLVGLTTTLSALSRYGKDWRMHRKVYTQAFRASVIPEYQPIISSKVDQFLSNLRQTPESFATHTRTFAGAVILATVYGYDVSPSGKDDLVDVVDKVVEALSAVSQPSAVVVNFLPFLRHLPLEFPIFAFQRIARETRKSVVEIRTAPYEFVKNSMASGSGSFSLLAKFLENDAAVGGDGHQEDIARDALTTAYMGGAETTVSVLEIFFLAMALHPKVQEQAQRELDAIVGKGRISNYADRSHLPYIEAILRETLRWAPVFPLGIFRAAFVDDIIDDYFIPKGTIVFSNIWAMTRDEVDYPEPESFIPERFLTEAGTCNDDQMSLAFGFGRRICPGRHFALSTLWTAMTSILSCFDIAEPKNEEGKPIRALADIEFMDGIVSRPGPFRCVIKPRMK